MPGLAAARASALARGLGGRRPPCSSVSSVGISGTLRRSCVAAAFIDAVTEARSCFGWRASRRVEQRHAVQRAVGPVVVGRGPAAAPARCSSSRACPSCGSIRLRVRAADEEAVPLVLPVPLVGRPRVDALGALRQAAGREHRDVAVVRVAGVERERRACDRLDERLRAVDVADRERRGTGAANRMSLPKLERLRETATRFARTSRSRSPGRARSCGSFTRPCALDRAGVDRAHLAALALVLVLRLRAAAQRLDELVDRSRAGRREAPREVLPAADQDVARVAGE